MSKTKKQTLTPDGTAAPGSPGGDSARGTGVSRRRLLGTAGAAGATG
ncbi:deferrochelatase/peroxidase EfeB, partial [Streptomyces anulatus]|nr:deferrochelatase/peroxidase EfeB [Streptomyces anulatus]